VVAGSEEVGNINVAFYAVEGGKQIKAFNLDEGEISVELILPVIKFFCIFLL
jgi:hypothetical protein